MVHILLAMSQSQLQSFSGTKHSGSSKIQFSGKEVLTDCLAVRNVWKYLLNESTGWSASLVINFCNATIRVFTNSGLNLSNLLRLCFSGSGYNDKTFNTVNFINLNKVTAHLGHECAKYEMSIMIEPVTRSTVHRCPIPLDAMMWDAGWQ